jgi:excisionase family DNA binding protein
MDNLNFPPRLSPSEVAVLLSISERTLARWIKAGLFPKPITFGRARRWEKAAVEAWMMSAKDAAAR